MDEPKEIKLRIQSLGYGDYDIFTVSPHISVEDLKKIVCQKNDFMLQTIRLLYKGKALISSSSIRDYGICDDDLIYAVPSPRIPPQYLPISFNITIQSSRPQIYRYRPDTRDYDRQINTMRTKIAEIQEACSSALIRISLTQNLLTRKDNPKSVKIPKAIIPSPGSNSSQEIEELNALVRAPVSKSINTVDLTSLSDEDKLNRFKHGCRIIQGKILEAVKTITANVASLKQYKVMLNNGELGAVFTREGQYPEPPALTRELLIENVTSGLGEIFGAPGSNLVPLTNFNFPTESDDRNSGDSSGDDRNRSRNDRNGRNRRKKSGKSSHVTSENVKIPKNSQMFPQHMQPQLPSEITNAVVKKAQEQVSQKQMHSAKKAHKKSRPDENIRGLSIIRRNLGGGNPMDPLSSLLEALGSSDESSSDSSDSNSDFLNDDDDFDIFDSDDENQQKRRKIKNKKKRRNREFTPELFRSLRERLLKKKKKHRRMEHQPPPFPFDIDSENEDPLDFFNGAPKKDSDDSDSNNDDNDEKPESPSIDNLNEFFSQDEINQLIEDQKIIEEAADTGAIPSLKPEYHQTRIIDGF